MTLAGHAVSEYGLMHAPPTPSVSFRHAPMKRDLLQLAKPFAFFAGRFSEQAYARLT